MSPPRLPIEKLPAWPRFLTLGLAAAYLGVSPTVFMREVKSAIWPQPRLRGDKGEIATWDRELLDIAADRSSGIDRLQPDNTPYPTISDEEIRRRIRAGNDKSVTGAMRKTKVQPG